MPILNYTTKVDSGKTLAQIQSILAKRGVRKMVIDYDDQGNAIALIFQLLINETPVGFALPCNWQGVQRTLKKAKVEARYLSPAHCLNVAWRIVKDWVEAQMAIIEAGMATMDEVFLPYAITKSGQTLYQHIASGNSNLLLTP